MINRRFRETKELEAYRDSTSKLIDALSEHFGVEGDVGSIMRALEDEKNKERPEVVPKTDESGEDGDSHAARMISRARAVMGTAEAYRSFEREAEVTKRVYPSFDLEAECRDPRFAKLAAAGLGIRGAYEALHHNELLAGAMQFAADRVVEASARGIDASSSRPAENGTEGGGASLPKRDVASLTKRDIMSILKRVGQGEKISFR